MSKLLVCEKPDQAQRYLSICNKEDAIIVCPTIVSYAFDYPTNLYFSQLPFTSLPPRYKPANLDPEWYLHLYSSLYTQDNKIKNHPVLTTYFYNKHPCSPYKSADSNTLEKARKDLYALLTSFDEIVFACDADHTGMRGFDFLFSRYFEIDDLQKFSENNQLTVTALINKEGFDEISLRKSMENRSDFFENVDVKCFRCHYQKKDFFEYNYNLNSLMLLNKTYFLALGKYPECVITKNFIQALFLLENIETEARFAQRLEKSFIGTPASRKAIMDNLNNLGLIDIIKKGPSSGNCICLTTRLSISEQGTRFLNLLHRKLNDPYLAERLLKDCENETLTLNDFKIKYDKYLDVVFSKQKRLINKHS